MTRALAAVLGVVAAVVASVVVLVGLAVSGGHDAPSTPALHLSKGERGTRPLPAAQTGYARSLQRLLDAARPAGEGRVVVRDCRAGRVGNEHFCAWTGSDGRCRAGFILEDPGAGTVPTRVGRVPLPPARCTTAAVLHWLGTHTREGS